jgi:hypothetical protein
MRPIETPQLSHLLDSARANAEHPGYIALQPIIDLIQVMIDRLSGKPQAKSRPSFPPRR